MIRALVTIPVESPRVSACSNRLGSRPPAAAAAASPTATLSSRPITPAQVVLCMMDLKLARLRRDPGHQDSMVDLIGYAAVLHEVTR